MSIPKETKSNGQFVAPAEELKRDKAKLKEQDVHPNRKSQSPASKKKPSSS